MIVKTLLRLHQDESGQDLLEYALVLSTVLVAVIVGSNSMAGLISSSFGHIVQIINATIAKV